MSNKIEEFLKENPPKYPIREFEEDILILLQKGCTQVQILKYLKEQCDFECSRQTLSKHIQHMKSTQNKTRVLDTKNESFKQQKAGAYTSSTKISEKEFMERIKQL